MLSDTQREVAVHLLANAMRRLQLREHDPATLQSGADASKRMMASKHLQSDEAYLRGMVDMLRAIYGPTRADEIYRTARAFERTASTR
jgi:hypothetical protein